MRKNCCRRGCIVLTKLGKFRKRFSHRLRPHVCWLHRSLIRPPNSFIISLRSFCQKKKMCSFVCEYEGTLAPAISSGWKVFKGLLHRKFLFETWLCQTLKNWISGNAFRDFKGVKERKQIYPPKQQILNIYFCDEEILHRWPCFSRMNTAACSLQSYTTWHYYFTCQYPLLFLCQCFSTPFMPVLIEFMLCPAGENINAR